MNQDLEADKAEELGEASASVVGDARTPHPAPVK